MDDVADRLDQAADALTSLSREVPTLAVAPGVFAAAPAPARGGVPNSGAGPGLIGQALHDHYRAVLEARAHEASAAGIRLAEMARSVRAARRQYAETDEAVERRFRRGS
jgi:hypothetical protein